MVAGIHYCPLTKLILDDQRLNFDRNYCLRQMRRMVFELRLRIAMLVPSTYKHRQHAIDRHRHRHRHRHRQHRQSSMEHIISGALNTSKWHVLIRVHGILSGSLWVPTSDSLKHDTPSYRNVLIGGAAIRNPWNSI